MASQLRIYGIAPGHLDEFIDAWAAGVRPLRRRHGFTVRAWVAAEANRFVWLVTCPGSRADFEARDAAYYASPERAALDPDPAAWIVHQELLFVDEPAEETPA